MSTEVALLRAVCDRPADDALRLVYADWLDDYSGCMPDPDAARTRAEFIRVQVELARTPGKVGCYRVGAERPGRHAGAWRCPKCELACRVETLFSRLPVEVTHGKAGRGSWTLSFPELRQWERGFAAAVECVDAAFWLTHADDILTCYPIRRVVLTDWPGVDVFDRGLRAFRFRAWVNHQFADWIDQACTERQFIRRMLAAEWPGIAFELPPGHDHI